MAAVAAAPVADAERNRLAATKLVTPRITLLKKAAIWTAAASEVASASQAMAAA